MLALTVLTLLTKNVRKSLQSLLEKIGVVGGAGVTILLMVLNKTWGFRLLEAIILEK